MNRLKAIFHPQQYQAIPFFHLGQYQAIHLSIPGQYQSITLSIPVFGNLKILDSDFPNFLL